MSFLDKITIANHEINQHFIYEQENMQMPFNHYRIRLPHFIGQDKGYNFIEYIFLVFNEERHDT